MPWSRECWSWRRISRRSDTSDFLAPRRTARFDSTDPRRKGRWQGIAGTLLAPDELMTESFAQLFEESLASQRIKPGAILMGRIVDIGPDVVLVNAGLKSE